MKNLPPNYDRNESRKTLRCHLVIFVLILLISSQIQALHIQNYKNEWNLHDFTEESGLAASNVFQIDFDSDNNAWLATSNGLVKFNGFDWITYTMKDGLPSNFVRSIHVVGSKSLWIGTDSGAVLFSNGIFSKNGSDTGLFGKNVRRIYKDRENTIWFCSDSWPSKKDFGGLTYLKNGKWVSVKSFEDEYVVNIFQDSKGKFFVITKNGVFIKEDDEWRKQLITNEPVNWTSSSVIEVNDMGVLVSTGENLFVFNNNRWETLKNIPYHSYGIANFGNSSFVILNTSRNDFKVFSIYEHRQFIPQTVEHRSIRGYIENLTADKKGNIWAVGYGSVLMWNVGQSEWVEYLEICEVLFPFQNGIVINELNNVIKFEPDGERTELFSISANARSINNANAVWDGKNIYLFESDRIKKITIPSHIEFNSIKNIAATEDNLWLLLDNNDRTNLARFNFTNWSIVNIPAGFEVNNISTNIDKKYLWLDMLNSSRDRRFISILHGDKFSTVTESEINYTEIKSDGFFIDSKHNIWIYNENEIINYNKQHNKWNRIKGLLGRSITQIHELGNYLWLVNASLLGGKDGISRISLIDGTISNFPTDIITCSFFDQHDKLIFGSVDKFFIVDSITHYQPFKINLPINGNIRSLNKIAEGKYFIAYENGLLLYQPQNIDARIELIDIPEETIVHTELFLNIKSIRKFTSSRYSNNFRYSMKINDGQWSHYFDQSQFAIKTDTLLIGENSIQLKYQDLPFNPIKEAEPIIITVHDIPLHKKPFFIPIVLMILLIMTFLAITAFRSESRLKKLVGIKTVELTATTQKYKDLFESANDAILIFEPHSEVILEANNKACEVYGFTKNELIGMSFKKITFDVKKGEDAIGKILSCESFRNFETKHYTKDGNVLDFLVNASLIEYNGKLSILTINHEITEIKKTEYEIKRLNRVYALLSNTNEAIVRTHDRQKLLNEICQIAVKEGKFKLAWIGMLNDSNTIEVTSSAQIFESNPGEKEINVSNIMQCQCLSESVMKSGNYIFVNDLENDKRVFSCKGDVLSMGCKSSASFPVKIFGKVSGTFNLFSDEIDFFHKEEIKLLDEMSIDISFALEFIETEKDRRKVETALLENELKLRNIFEHSTNVFYSHDVNHVIQFISPQIEKLLGYPVEYAERKWTEFLSDNPVNEIGYQKTVAAIETGVAQDPYELELIHKNGNKVFVEVREAPVVENGRTVAIVGSLTDITARKKAEDEVESEKILLKTIIDNIPDAIYTKDLEYRKSLANKADLINMGAEDESEVLGKTDFDFFPKEDAEKFIKIDKQIIEEGKTILNVEESFVDSEGNTHWLLTSKLPLLNNRGEIEGLLGIGRDITKRKHAEDELKKRLEFEKVISSVSSNFINIKPEEFNKTVISTLCEIGSIADVDRSYLFMFSDDLLYCINTHEWCKGGIEPQIDNLQRVPVAAIPWRMEHLSRFETIHIPNVSDLPGGASVEKEILEAQEIKSLIVVPLVSLNKLIGFIGFDSVKERKIWAGEDIFLLKMLGEIFVSAINKINAETALKESEGKLRTLFNASIEGICLTDENEKIILVNPRMEEMMGYSRGEMINKDFKILIPANELDDYSAKNELRKKGKSEIYEWKLRTKYGTHLWVMISASPVLDEQGKYKGSFGMFTDITELKIAEEEVRKLYRGVEQSPASVLITDINGNIEYVNKTFCDVTGYSYSEVIGKNPRFLNPGEKSKEYYSELWNTILSGKDWHGEFHNKKKNGELFWESASISPITDDKGEITHFIGITEDITEKKLVQENLRMSEQQFRSIWENSFDGMRLTDQEGIIVEVNNAFCNLVNKDKSELIGENFILPYADKDVRAIEKYKENFRNGTVKPKLETKVQLWNGEEKWISLSNSFVRLEKETILVLSIFRDITDQKNYENNLMTAKVKAESSEKLKTEFLAQISHEIRTPLNALMSYTTLLHDELKADKSEEFEELFNGISNSGSRIIRTIDLILNASELQTGGYYAIKKSVDIFNDVVVKVHNDFERFAKSKELEFRIKNFTENSYTICDEYSVYQSIVNLVDNAIKYTEKGSIELILKRNKSNQMQIEIEDTGIGISEEYLEHLFEPFTQEETGYSRKFEGIGLGLSLVKKYCKINNIQIDVESKKNVGTKFTLTFNG